MMIYYLNHVISALWVGNRKSIQLEGHVCATFCESVPSGASSIMHTKTHVTFDL